MVDSPGGIIRVFPRVFTAETPLAGKSRRIVPFVREIIPRTNARALLICCVNSNSANRWTRIFARRIFSPALPEFRPKPSFRVRPADLRGYQRNEKYTPDGAQRGMKYES